MPAQKQVGSGPWEKAGDSSLFPKLPKALRRKKEVQLNGASSAEIEVISECHEQSYANKLNKLDEADGNS